MMTRFAAAGKPDVRRLCRSLPALLIEQAAQLFQLVFEPDALAFGG
jgi:hypothetical protein